MSTGKHGPSRRAPASQEAAHLHPFLNDESCDGLAATRRVCLSVHDQRVRLGPVCAPHFCAVEEEVAALVLRAQLHGHLDSGGSGGRGQDERNAQHMQAATVALPASATRQVRPTCQAAWCPRWSVLHKSTHHVRAGARLAHRQRANVLACTQPSGAAGWVWMRLSNQQQQHAHLQSG